MKHKLRVDTANGFTLIELIFVLIIMAVLTHVSIPYFQNQLEKSRLSELALRIDALRVAFKTGQELGNPAIVSFPIAPQGTIPAELSALPIQDNLQYPNLGMQLMPSHDTYQQFIGGVTRPYLVLSATTPEGSATLLNLSEVLPESSWAWWVKSRLMVIPLLDIAAPAQPGIPGGGTQPPSTGNPPAGTTPDTGTTPANPGGSGTVVVTTPGSGTGSPGNSGNGPGQTNNHNSNCVHPGSGHAFGRCRI